jgi:outer membrane protein W
MKIEAVGRPVEGDDSPGPVLRNKNLLSRARRKTMRRIAFTTLVLSITIMFVTSSSAMAQERPGYITFKAGVYTPTDDLDDAGFDAGFHGEIAFGGRLSENFALEAGVGYFHTDASFSGFDPLLGFWSEDDDVTVVPFSFTAKALVPSESAEFYVGGGFGIYLAIFEADFDSGAISLSLEDTDTLFGAHLLVGANFNLNEVTFIGFEGKYIFTEEGKAEDSIFGIPIVIKTNLDGYTITGHIGFRF